MMWMADVHMHRVCRMYMNDISRNFKESVYSKENKKHFNNNIQTHARRSKRNFSQKKFLPYSNRNSYMRLTKQNKDD